MCGLIVVIFPVKEMKKNVAVPHSDFETGKNGWFGPIILDGLTIRQLISDYPPLAITLRLRL